MAEQTQPQAVPQRSQNAPLVTVQAFKSPDQASTQRVVLLSRELMAAGQRASQACSPKGK